MLFELLCLWGVWSVAEEAGNIRKEVETNNTVDDRERRKKLRCSYCRPNRGENAKRRPAHGKTKPKYKDHRK